MAKLSNKNLKISGLVALAAILIIAYLSLNADKTQNEPIKISVGTWPGYGDIFIAQEKGIFEKNNVKVEIVFFKSFGDAVDAYNNGQTDGGYTTWPEAITSSFSGVNSKVVYVVDLSTTGDSIVGVGNSLSDAKGGIIGIGDVDGFSHIFALKALELANLSEKDVGFKVVLPENVLSELESGQIVAGHTWEPYKSEAIKNGYHTLATDAEARIINDVLVFNSEITKQRPDDIKNIIKSLAEARQYRLANLDESISIMARGEGMADDEMRSGLEGLESFDLQDNYKLLTGTDPQDLRGTGKFISEFYVNIGQLNQLPNFDDLVEPDMVGQLVGEGKKP